MKHFLRWKPKYVKLRMPDGRVLTYFVVAKDRPKRGEILVVYGGVYEGEVGEVVKRFSRYDNYAYEAG